MNYWIKYALVLGSLLFGMVLCGCIQHFNDIKADDTSNYIQKVGNINIDDTTTAYIYNDTKNKNTIYIGFNKNSNNAISIQAVPWHN